MQKRIPLLKLTFDIFKIKLSSNKIEYPKYIIPSLADIANKRNVMRFGMKLTENNFQSCTPLLILAATSLLSGRNILLYVVVVG